MRLCNICQLLKIKNLVDVVCIYFTYFYILSWYIIVMSISQMIFNTLHADADL